MYLPAHVDETHLHISHTEHLEEVNRLMYKQEWFLSPYLASQYIVYPYRHIPFRLYQSFDIYENIFMILPTDESSFIIFPSING